MAADAKVGGGEVSNKTCKGCLYQENNSTEEPCNKCSANALSKSIIYQYVNENNLDHGDEVNNPKNEMLESIKHQCEMMTHTLITKNKDYGNSFENTLNKYGDVALMLRLEDKFKRLESLFRNKENLVKDEGFEDTLRDLAGYCLLYLAVKSK